MKYTFATERATNLILLMIVGAATVASTLPAQLPDSSIDAFHSATTRAKLALARDAGRLWGSRLDSVPWLGVSGKTILLTSAPVGVAGYTQTRGVWEGPLPTTITPSNTSVTWAGRHWAMVLLPVYGDTLGAERLLIHEAMHVLQPSVLPAPSYDETGAGSGLLDEAAGRSWLRLEWKALATALRSSGAKRDSAVHDALLFRAARYAIASPDEITRERALDVKEGIPEYTGWKLSNSPRAAFIASLDSAPTTLPSFVRAFEYFTGPAYAMLLDDYTNGRWHRALKDHPDLQSMIAGAIAPRNFPDESLVQAALATDSGTAVSPAVTQLAHSRAQVYGGPAIVAEENVRWTNRERELAAYRKEFLDSPTIRLRPHSLNVSFNPRGQASLGAAGTVMANLAWKSADGASLTAPSGALINQSWTELRVSLGAAHLEPGVVKQTTTINGDGWTLVLVPGWTVRADGASMVITP
ncbi:MAG TPA: hypothetical protein VLI40_04640, partial [Gemmatimonadaceae bacterium]|nr:hypothetical protein [Gemmatimonadaceae bacterium]